MTAYREISVLWSLINILFVFSQLYVSRYPRRRTFQLNFFFMGILIMINMYLLIVMGFDWLGKYFILTCTLPSLLYFFYLSADRNGRFFFTFCIADIAGFWIICVTNLITYAFGNNYFLMLVLRMVFFLALEFIIVRYLRKPYQAVLRFIKKGWFGFAFASGLFYLFFALLSSWPSPVTDRPDSLPAFILFLIILPLVYFTLFRLLYQQYQLNTRLENESILVSQLSCFQNQLLILKDTEEKNRILRHDFRHYINQISLGLRENNIPSVLQYISHFEKLCSESGAETYCSLPAVNSCLTFYVKKAEENSITVTVDFTAGPQDIPDEIEFSIMLANSFENAIRAVSCLPEAERWIQVRCYCPNQLLYEIANSCLESSVVFDENHIPITANASHGIGTRSILAYAQKNNASADYLLDHGIFRLRILFLPPSASVRITKQYLKF